MCSLFNSNSTGKTIKAKLDDVDVVDVYCDNYQKQINFLRRTLNDFVDVVLICSVLKIEDNEIIENTKTVRLNIVKKEKQKEIVNGSYLSTFVYQKKTYNAIVFVDNDDIYMSFLSKEDEKELHENENIKITLIQFIRKQESDLTELELKKAIISDFNICRQLLLNFNKSFN